MMFLQSIIHLFCFKNLSYWTLNCSNRNDLQLNHKIDEATAGIP